MYCPKCGSHNTDETKFCRVCGANISLVTQALTGQVAPAPTQPTLNLDQRQLSKGFSELFMGIGFAAIAIFSFAVKGMGWGIWMFIPAFAMIGTGVAHLAPLFLAKQLGQPAPLPTQSQAPQSLPPRNTKELPPARDYESLPPPSVTESTTRHLEAQPVQQRPREREF